MKSFFRSVFFIFSFIIITNVSYAASTALNFNAPTENRDAGGEFPRILKVDDMNNDGHADMVIGVLSDQDALIVFMLGDGLGGFAINGEFRPSFFSYNDFITDDFNNDGIQDIAVSQYKYGDNITPDSMCNKRSEGVMIFLGLGGESPRFNFKHCIERGVPARSGVIASGDLNGDGIADIILTDRLAGLIFYTGLGDGSFSSIPTVVSDYYNSVAIEIADVNGDGQQDIISDAGIFLGNSDGSFTLGGPALSYFVTDGFVNAYSLADINGDGITDVVNIGNVTNIPSSSILNKVTMSYYDVTTKEFNHVVNTIVGSAPMKAIAAADLNGDSFADVILYYTGGSLDVLLGTGDGHLLAAKSLSIVEGPYWPPYFNSRKQSGSTEFTAGDWNEDGLQDMAMISYQIQKTASLWVALQSPVAPINDRVAPSINLTAPLANSIVSGVVSVTATASDNVAVTRVDFYQDTALIGNSVGPNYQASWDTMALTNGVYNMSARAFDAAGNETSSAGVSVTVDNATVVTPLPTVPPPPPVSGTGTKVDAAGIISNVGADYIEANGVRIYYVASTVLKFNGVSGFAVGLATQYKGMQDSTGRITASKIEVN